MTDVTDVTDKWNEARVALLDKISAEASKDDSNLNTLHTFAESYALVAGNVPRLTG